MNTPNFQLTLATETTETLIRIGSDILSKLPEDIEPGPAKRVYVLADQAVSSVTEEVCQALQAAGWQVTRREVHVSEAFKDFESIYPIYGELLEAGLTRQDWLVAIGGGVIGDAGGFIAATYLRGIRWVGVPTTLLAQVDSSIGGKTGVNHAQGKNLVGAFHQPSLVVCDINSLASLSERDRISGLGEMLKYGLTYDPDLFDYLRNHWQAMLELEPGKLSRAITASLQWKIHAVQQDERDLSGIREVLNFGHTVGHALEAATRYETYRHGEAVLWGMRFALELSVMKGHLKPAKAEAVLAFLATIPLPPLPETDVWQKALEAIKYDKKSEGQQIRFVLLMIVGQVITDRTVTREDLEQVYLKLTGVSEHLQLH